MHDMPSNDTLGRVAVIIPAFNEQDSIGLVLGDLPPVGRVLVVDNASTDATADVAAEHGATVVDEPTPGYGRACLAGMAELERLASEDAFHAEIVVFLDGDYSDHPDELPEVIRPIVKEDADFVIGSRALGEREPGSMLPQQRFGNWLACTLMKWLYGVRHTDLGPFRAIRAASLQSLGMRDQDFGWTVEMQLKAAHHKLRTVEVPVSYRRRVGISKISGTIRGTVLAGYKILSTIFKYRS